ncbi:CsbD family protein [Oryzibacter oryziterrae]|uniref:CsbD family protein n=1 Tax=Oryzibacter oryziterrae TaxID=2766474 RepID=UPI001F261884|nr:CsbD family protein [Oryzibacter oryziterrae]
MNKDQIIGTAKQAAGTVTAKAGEVLQLKELETKGKVVQIKGKFQKNVGNIRDVLKD